MKGIYQIVQIHLKFWKNILISQFNIFTKWWIYRPIFHVKNNFKLFKFRQILYHLKAYDLVKKNL